MVDHSESDSLLLETEVPGSGGGSDGGSGDQASTVTASGGAVVVPSSSSTNLSVLMATMENRRRTRLNLTGGVGVVLDPNVNSDLQLMSLEVGRAKGR
jgi:hypothetical protein